MWWSVRPRPSTTSSAARAAAGEEYLPEQVHAVVQTQLAYLREIGAIGGAADTDEGDPDETGPDVA